MAVAFYSTRCFRRVTFLPSNTLAIANPGLIGNGMRGAVRYGTAETASLYSLPVYIFGKTGTATQINGFRSQGWFVGFASPLDNSSTAESESMPKSVKLAVLVFLTRAHGSDAAEVARPIFEEYSRFAETQGRGETEIRAAVPATERLGDTGTGTRETGKEPRTGVTLASPRLLLRPVVVFPVAKTSLSSLSNYVLALCAEGVRTHQSSEAWRLKSHLCLKILAAFEMVTISSLRLTPRYQTVDSDSALRSAAGVK